MKAFIRGLIFVFITLHYSSYVSDALRFGDSKVMFLFLLAFTLLNLFVRSIVALVSLPTDGPYFWFLSALLHVILVNILAVVLPGFWIKGVTTTSLIILGIVIPSKSLSIFWAGTLAVITISILYNFLDWLSLKDKKSSK